MEYEKIKIEEWELMGEGEYGQSYSNRATKELMLKFPKDSDNNFLTIREFQMSQKLTELGCKIPRAIQILEEPYSQRFGILYERIPEKMSLARMVERYPSKLEKIVKMHAEEAKKFHAIQCNEEHFESIKKDIQKHLDRFPTLFSRSKNIIREALIYAPECNNALQMDFHPGNIVHSGKTHENYWIDMADFSIGYHMFDIGILYMFLQIQKKDIRVQAQLHMTEQQMNEYWEQFVLAYYGKPLYQDSTFIKKVKIYALLACVSRFYRMPMQKQTRFYLTNYMCFKCLWGISKKQVKEIMEFKEF